MKSLVIWKAPSLPILKSKRFFYWLNKHSCPESLARSIWNWIKKGWALFIQRWVLTQRESSAPDCREDGLGKDLYYLPTGIRTLSLWRGLPCDLGQKRLQSLFPQQDPYPSPGASTEDGLLVAFTTNVMLWEHAFSAGTRRSRGRGELMPTYYSFPFLILKQEGIESIYLWRLSMYLLTWWWC